MAFPPKPSSAGPGGERAPETSHNAVVKAVKHALWYKGIPPHSTALTVRENAPEVFDSYFKFAFVRNPWDWQVSNYHYILKTPWHFMHNTAKSLGSFDAYVDYIGQRRVIRRQKDYLTDAEGRVIVDFIGRFESLADDFKTVCGRIGIPYRMEHENPSSRERDYRVYYSDRTAALIEEYFRDDIEMFGYRF